MNGTALAKPFVVIKPKTGTPLRSIIRPADLFWATFASTLIPISLIWDFSWESTIGVDRFWSPPHLATQMGGWLSGLLGIQLVIRATRWRFRGEQAPAVGLGWLCAPSGAWVLLWGAALLQAALLLDNWWQQAYGLGAGLWPPPQILKTVGFFTILFGGALLCAAAQSNNRERVGLATHLLSWHGGMMLGLCAVALTMINYPNRQHTGTFYLASCAIYPAVLIGVGRATSGAWGVSRVAVGYIAMVCAMVWLLPLFPGRPLVPPVHNAMDRMMPPPFPLLLVVPALFLDVFQNRAKIPFQSKPLWNAMAAGFGFFALFLPVQWFFARFLLSSPADNWFFAGGGRHWPFFLKTDGARRMFWLVKQDPLTWRVSLIALALAIVSAWVGLRAASWLRQVHR